MEKKSFRIRPFAATTADYIAVIAIHNAVWPVEAQQTVAELQARDGALDKNYLFQRDVVEWEGQIVAYGQFGQSPWAYHPRKYWIDLTVLPEFEERGIGTAYLNHFLRFVAARKPLSVICRTYEDKTGSLRFLTRRGFTELTRYLRSELDIGRFQPEQWLALLARVEANGIQLLSAAQLAQQDPRWQRRLYDLHMGLRQESFSGRQKTPPSFERYRADPLQAPNFLPEGWHIACIADADIGLTMLFDNHANPGQLLTGFTGVRRAYRRQGIATALKIKALMYAKSAGFLKTETNNEVGNPMYALNQQLGFRPLPARLVFRKLIGKET